MVAGVGEGKVAGFNEVRDGGDGVALVLVGWREAEFQRKARGFARDPDRRAGSQGALQGDGALGRAVGDGPAGQVHCCAAHVHQAERLVGLIGEVGVIVYTRDQYATRGRAGRSAPACQQDKRQAQNDDDAGHPPVLATHRLPPCLQGHEHGCHT